MAGQICDRLRALSAGAVAALVAFNVGLGLAVYLDFTQPFRPTSPTPIPTDDLKFYQSVADAVRAGGDYYQVTGALLRAGGYPVASVFRWRLPTLTWLAAAMPNDGWRRGALMIAWFTAIAIAIAAGWRPLSALGRFTLVLGLGGVAWWTGVGLSQYAHELWAAALILLSVSLLRLRLSWPAVAAGLASLAIREHAVVYCLTACGIAAWQKRRPEAIAWAAGMVAFLVFFWWHSRQVLAHLTPEEIAGSAGVRPWIRFGGLAFVMQTVRVNAILFYLPGWVAYLYLAAALYGLTHISGEFGRLLLIAVGLYLAAFAVIGQEFNGYWGLIYAPLLPLGLAQACPSAKRLLALARWQKRDLRRG